MSVPLNVRIEALLAPVAAQEGFELVAVETAGTKKVPVIRIFLDREGGIDIDAIVEANRWISQAIDEADIMLGSYTLEVSSPGVDRPITKLSDFKRFVGESVTVKTMPIEGRRTFTGAIVAVEGEEVVLNIGGGTVHVPYSAVRKAHLMGKVDFGTKGAGTR